ncbi:polysaccharide pyruvyl transferase CsaB [bacterium]|nr:polysaccharide pyruvyl transferase CsaB [bacterium]NIN91754.1 polysaccharide pyruvyl transferase CsaB [bacterium]NIO18057.1 polysaccharide pyruvyl transferase CsaB [bacterium]NIO73029.1 polysaccharide pyruvyl transferase CsaB [bacterium]
MANRILIAGYYGFDNGGDELILFSLLNQLKKLNDKLEITVLSRNPSRTGKSYKVNAINRWNPFGVALAILHTELFVFGGGGLLQDLTSSWSIYYYLGLILLAKLFFKKVLLISQGVGPIRRKISRKVTKIVLGFVDLITARDELSKFELGRLNVGLSVFIVPDPVFNLDRFAFTSRVKISSTSPLCEGRGSLSNQRPVIGVCLQGGGKGERFTETIREICDELVTKIESKILFIPFHKGEDWKISKDVIAKSINDYQLFLWQDVEDLFKIYDKIDLVLGMRLHSIILACLLGKPFVAISLPETHPLYDPKVEGFLELLGHKAIDMAIPVVEIAEKVNQILANRQSFLEQLFPRVAKLKECSRKNMEIVQSLL